MSKELLVSIIIVAAVHGTPAYALKCPAGTSAREITADTGKTVLCSESNKTLHGPAISYNVNGTIISEDYWDHGKKTGVWKVFHDSGSLRSSTTYDSGAKQGTYGEWLPDGQRVIWGTFDANEEHGVWTFRGSPERYFEAFYIVFDHGEDVTSKLASEITDSCTTWSQFVEIEREGMVAIIGYLSTESLSEKNQAHIKDHAELAACIANSVDTTVKRVDEECRKEKPILHTLPSYTSELALNCILDTAGK